MVREATSTLSKGQSKGVISKISLEVNSVNRRHESSQQAKVITERGPNATITPREDQKEVPPRETPENPLIEFQEIFDKGLLKPELGEQVRMDTQGLGTQSHESHNVLTAKNYNLTNSI